MPPCLSASGRAGALPTHESPAGGAARSECRSSPARYRQGRPVSERLQPFDAQDLSVVRASLPPWAFDWRYHLVEQLNEAAKG